MINNTNVENNHVTTGDAKTVYPITFGGATDSGGLPMFKVTLTYADDSSKELVHNVDYKLVYDEVQENNIESLNKPSLIGIKFLLDEYLVAGNKLDIVRVTPFEQQIDFQIGRIDPEQIEKAFDASVMRDQELRNQMEHISKETSEDVFELSSSIADINATLETKASKTELSDAVKTLNTDIKGNADAIKKTRDDMNAKDSQLETTLNTHTNELTTLRGNQASLGNQVAGIEGKIPESASGSNPLITKQQLSGTETDIRKDLNSGLSGLQTQITAQAAEIKTKQEKLVAGDNIIISGNVISATGTGGAGFDAIVVQELPESGLKGVIYLVPSDGETPDVYDEYLWIESTGTFELIGKTKVDLSDYATKEDLSNYLPLSGGTLTGDLTISESYLLSFNGKYAFKYGGTNSGQVIFGDVSAGWFNPKIVFSVAGYGALFPGGDGVVTLGLSGSKWKRTYTNIINNGADLLVPTEGGTLARLEDLENIDTLPDQTGNAGKVLTTDGETASWQEASGGTTITLKEYDE